MKWGFFRLKGTDFSLKEGANFNGNLKKEKWRIWGYGGDFDVIEKRDLKAFQNLLKGSD